MRAYVLLLLVLGCTHEPDDAPRGDPVAPECAACLRAEDGGGCGVVEAECSRDARCEEALLCELRFDCWSRFEPSSCGERAGCPSPSGDAGARLGAVEDCARDRCAVPCGIQAP